MLAAYCDESWKDRDAPFVVAGYVGQVRQWRRLERKWRRALWKAGLTEFHMSDCEGGYGEFAGMSREQRNSLQKRFIGIINDHDVRGAMCVVSVTDYAVLLPKLRLIPKDRKYIASPYFLAFEHCVQELCDAADFYARGEPINFFFDQQRQFQGRAKELYDQALQVPELPFHPRLGDLSFASKREVVSLQAADILAYESLRHGEAVTKAKAVERWQKTLLDKRPMGGRLFDRRGLEVLLQTYGIGT